MTRRLTIAAIAALAAAGTLGASSATADTGVTQVQVSDDYIACAGVRALNVATCVREPIRPIFDAVLP